MTTSIAALFVGVVLIGLVSFVPTFLESTTNAAPVVAGLAVAALTLGWPVSASVAGRFYLRIGFRATTLIGSVFTVAGAGLLAVFALSPSIPLTALACFIVGLGLGLVAAPSLIAAQSSVEMRRRGVASGTNLLARSIGSAVGVAVFGAIANALIARARRRERACGDPGRHGRRLRRGRGECAADARGVRVHPSGSRGRRSGTRRQPDRQTVPPGDG